MSSTRRTGERRSPGQSPARPDDVDLAVAAAPVEMGGWPGVVDASEDFALASLRVVRALTDVAFDSLFPGDGLQSDREGLRATVDEVRRLMHVVLADGGADDLVDLLNGVARNGVQIERALVVWVDLIESLVQTSERSYGTAAGRGRVKLAEVREVVFRLVSTAKLKIPNVPAPIQPMVLRSAVDWTVDAVVMSINRYDLWVDVSPTPTSLRARVVLVLARFGRLLSPLLRALAAVVAPLWSLLLPRRPLTPEVKRAFEAVQREGLLLGVAGGLSGIADLLVWVGTHRQQVLAMADIVFVSVREAEYYSSLTGPQKKAFARDLTLAVLDELGLDLRVGLLLTVAESVTDGVIEAAVHLFNKRGLFTHSA